MRTKKAFGILELLTGFEDYQKPALANFGTAYGVVSIVSTRIMLHFTRKEFGVTENPGQMRDGFLSLSAGRSGMEISSSVS